jgi:hypothetical protein
VIPCEFIGFAKSQCPVELPNEVRQPVTQTHATATDTCHSDSTTHTDTWSDGIIKHAWLRPLWPRLPCVPCVLSDMPVCMCLSYVAVNQAVSNHDELMSNFFAQPGTHTHHLTKSALKQADLTS